MLLSRRTLKRSPGQRSNFNFRAARAAARVPRCHTINKQHHNTNGKPPTRHTPPHATTSSWAGGAGGAAPGGSSNLVEVSAVACRDEVNARRR